MCSNSPVSLANGTAMNNNDRKFPVPIALWQNHDILTLTNQQKELIQKTWKDDEATLYEIGTEIYSYIFAIEPAAKRLFPTATAAGDNWKQSPIFREQGLRFARVLSQVVRYINRPSRLTPILLHIGYCHQKYKDRGFEPKHWDIFQEAVKVVLSEHIQDHFFDMNSQDLNIVMLAWVDISGFIIATMKKGFEAPKDPSISIDISDSDTTTVTDTTSTTTAS